MTESKNIPWLIRAYALDGKGSGMALDAKAIGKKLPEKTFWVHLHGDPPETRKWLKTIAGLDKITISAMLEEETRPRVHVMEQGTLIILRGVNLNENAEPDDMVSIRIFVTDKGVFSIRRRKLKAAEDMEEVIKSGNGPKTPGEFFVMFLHLLLERMQPTFTALDDAIDATEEMADKDNLRDVRERLADLRKDVVMFRRYLLPQRDALASLRLSGPKWLGRGDLFSLQEGYDRTVRILEELDAGRERIQIIQDQIANALANEMNERMYLLSIIAALFLPLGFLTGLLGINVAGIPGADYPEAFWVFVGLLVAVVGGMLIYFKRRGWL